MQKQSPKERRLQNPRRWSYLLGWWLFVGNLQRTEVQLPLQQTWRTMWSGSYGSALNHEFWSTRCSEHSSDNWEWAITFAHVCKTWRTTLENWLSQIGFEAMQGGCHRKLNTDAFLVKLTEKRFQNAETIYVPCGKAVDLYVNDVRRRCPLMKTLVHSKWLSVDRGYEFVQQGV